MEGSHILVTMADLTAIWGHAQALWLLSALRRRGLAKRVGFLPRNGKRGRPAEVWRVPKVISILGELSCQNES